MFEWSVDALLAAGAQCVVVAAPEDLLATGAGLQDAARVRFVPGGETRQQSVLNALRRVSADEVVVHDAARPLVRSQLVLAVLRALEEGDCAGALSGLPIDETVKEIELRTEPRVVARTMPRAPLWVSQTPQAFKTVVLLEAHEKAQREGVTATDDAQLVELAGGRCLVVRGDRWNIKVTYPEDLALAEALLKWS